LRTKEAILQSPNPANEADKTLALTVLRQAFIERDPTAVDRRFSKS